MDFKKSILILIMAIFLVSIAGVCASDANDTMVASEDNLEIEQKTDDIIGVGEDAELAFPDENNQTFGSVRSSDANPNPILNQGDSASEVLGSDYDVIPGIDFDDSDSSHFTIIINFGSTHYVEGDTFADIQNTIYGSSEWDTIVLTGGKTYSGDGSPILIKKHLTLTSQGGNAILDAQNLSSILKVYQGCQVTVENIDFINGMESNTGGAIIWGGPNGHLKNCNFIGNKATNYAGAFVWIQNDGTIENCNFINNSAGNSGAVLVGGYRNKFINCNFTTNSANYQAGALYLAFDGNEVINCSFMNNTAPYAGAVRTQGSNDKFIGCYFVQNSALFFGALSWIPCNDSNPYWGNHTLSECNFVNNSATAGCAGAIYCYAHNVNILHSNFTNNSARGQTYGYGGAIYIQGMNDVVSDCIFKDNFASIYGGAIGINSFKIDDNGRTIRISNGLVTDSVFIDNSANHGNAILCDGFCDQLSQITQCTFKYKANSADLNLNDENLSLTFDLKSSLSYRNTVSGYERVGVLTFWNGESFESISMNSVYFTEDIYPIYGTARGVNQSMILEIYNSTNGLVANITGLTDSSGQFTYDYRGLPEGQYSYRAYHPDNDDFAFVLKEGSFERYHLPTFVSISVSNVTYPESARATVTASSPGTYKLVIAGIEYDDITFTDSEISNGGGNASKTVNVNPLGANDNYEASVTYEMTDMYYGASNQTRFNVYKAGTRIDVADAVGYYGEYSEIAYAVVNVTAANIAGIRNGTDELVEGRDYSIISNENGKIIVGGLAIGTYVVNLTAAIDDNHYPSSKEFNLTIKPSVDLSIDVAASNQNPFYGDTIAYTVTVANNGPNLACDVIVTCTVPEGVNVSSQDAGYRGNGIWNISSIAAGNESAIALTLYATMNRQGATTIGFNVCSSVHDGNTKNDNAGVTVNAKPISNLNVASHTDANPDVLIGDLVTYTVTVSNNGPLDARNVKVTGYLSELLQFVSAKAGTGNYNSSTGVWAISELKVDEMANLTLTLKAISDGTVKNTFHVESDEDDPDTSDNAVDMPLVIKPLVDLSIDVATSNQNPFYGDTISYMVTVANSGPSIACDVIVACAVPEGVNVSSQDAGYRGNGIWNISGIDAGNESAIALTLYATLNRQGAITIGFNVCSSVHDGNAGNDNAGVTVNAKPISNLNVASHTDANPDVLIGDLVTYTIAVSNNGPSDARNVKVTGYLSELLQFVSAKAGTGNYNSSTGVWTIGELKVDEMANLTLTLKAISDGTVKNAFHVESDENNPNSLGNSVDTMILSANKISTALDCKNMATTAIDKAVDGKKGQYYSLILRDGKMNPLVGKAVQITLDKVTYNVKTDSKGVAMLQVNIKKAGTYTASVKFAGDGKYLGSIASVKIKVNKQKPKIISNKKRFSLGSKKKITATLKTSRGKILKSKSMVFIIKGKKYKATTNSKGIATVKVKLTKKGKYTCRIKYAGDATYSSIVKKISVVIK